MFRVFTSLPRAVGRPVGGRFLVRLVCGRPSVRPAWPPSARIQFDRLAVAVRPLHDGPPPPPPPPPPPSEKLTPREKLKKAAKEYGAVLVAFHVGISLMSLGTVYLLLCCGVDTQQWISWLGASDADENARIVAGASQFIVAYAIHKSMAPIRISITLVSVPLIVRYLRAKGFMKKK